ncbi:unnamed protein product [Angiostrongylus costaricensis]|uniref:MPN domain-containing protein n=1 Tax=Angiostrongylus costaricensis TaxID=334426 RepID=A0A158PKQ3_ANGCS|nr:unnamed protein product [Angiostrongylus costaricensis]
MGAKEVSDDPTHPDTAETVHISALALLKMLRHARSGVPLEVMGLMLGTFVDDYTINVVDVFAMPQSGTSVTVESVDPVYQTRHLDLLKQTGRVEMVVGWYHSHPGFGCWLSSVDVSTQQSFEALHPRAIALVVMLDAFRSINPLAVNPRLCAPTAEARQTTSNMGHLVRPSLVSTVHGLGLRYYSLNCAYKLTTREQKMLSRLNQKTWLDGMVCFAFSIDDSDLERNALLVTMKYAPSQNINKFSSCEQANSDHIQEMLKLTNLFVKVSRFTPQRILFTNANNQELFKDLHSEKSANTNEQRVKRYGRLNAKQKLEQVRTCCHQVTNYCL